MIVTICPYCGAISNTQTAADEKGGTPLGGDVSICAGCGEVAIFDFAMPANVREPTDDEQAHIAQCPEVKQARAIIVSRTIQ